MKNIVFGVGAFSSHLNASFQIAKQLKQRGHRIIYVGAIDLEVDVGAQGFEFEQVFTEFPGPGDSKEDLNHNKLSYLQKRKNARKMQEFLQGDIIERIVKKLEPDLFIIDAFHIFYVLVLHKYPIPTVILEDMVPGDLFDNLHISSK